MADTKTLSSNEKSELLRYFVGDRENGYVPFLQDARYRDLVEQFRASDERKNDNSDDPRVSPFAAQPAEITDTNDTKNSK